jgi:hypothetical protein
MQTRGVALMWRVGYREEPQLQKMGDYVLHLERMLNEMKFHRQKKQLTRDSLLNEYTVAEDMEAREQARAYLCAPARGGEPASLCACGWEYCFARSRYD